MCGAQDGQNLCLSSSLSGHLENDARKSDVYVKTSPVCTVVEKKRVSVVPRVYLRRFVVLLLSAASETHRRRKVPVVLPLRAV